MFRRCQLASSRHNPHAKLLDLANRRTTLPAAEWKTSFQSEGYCWSEVEFLFRVGTVLSLGMHRSYFLSGVSGNFHTFEFILFYLFILFFISYSIPEYLEYFSTFGHLSWGQFIYLFRHKRTLFIIHSGLCTIYLFLIYFRYQNE